MTTPELDARIAKWQAMATQFPKSELPRFSLAKAYLEAQRLEEAAEAFAEVGRLKPDFMMAFVHRAEALMALGRNDEARAACERGLELAIAQHHSGPQEDCERMLEELSGAA